MHGEMMRQVLHNYDPPAPFVTKKIAPVFITCRNAFIPKRYITDDNGDESIYDKAERDAKVPSMMRSNKVLEILGLLRVGSMSLRIPMQMRNQVLGPFKGLSLFIASACPL